MTNPFDESGRDMRRFYRSLEIALTRYATLEETERGYALTYTRASAKPATLASFERGVRTRFPALEVSSEAQADGGLRIDLGGSAESREFIEGMIASAQAGAFRLPSPWRLELGQAWRRATSSLRMQPSFLVIGAPRCGTTSLYSYLCEHPAVHSAVQKELGFFDIFYSRGLGSYRAGFPLASRAKAPASGAQPITGEATPTYLAHPTVPERVRQAFPRMKLIAMVRDPIARAYSQYHLGVRNGVEALSFEEAIDSEEERLAGELDRIRQDASYASVELVYHSYLTTGHYAEHLERWMQSFSRDQLLVVGTEVFTADPHGEYGRILDFLELPPFEPPNFQTLNAFPYPDLDASMRARLEEYFRPRNEELWNFLGADLGWNRDAR